MENDGINRPLTGSMGNGHSDAVPREEYLYPARCIMGNMSYYIEFTPLPRIVCKEFGPLQEKLEEMGYLVTRLEPVYRGPEPSFKCAVVIEFTPGRDTYVSAFKLQQMFENVSKGKATLYELEDQRDGPNIWVATREDLKYLTQMPGFALVASSIRHNAIAEVYVSQVSHYNDLRGTLMQLVPEFYED